MVSAGSAKLCHAPAGEPRLVHMGACMGFRKRTEACQASWGLGSKLAHCPFCCISLSKENNKGKLTPCWREMQAHTTKGVDTGRSKDHGCLYSLLCLLRGHLLLNFLCPSLPNFKIYVCVCIYMHTYGSILSVFSSVWLLRCVWLFATPWTVARQASLSITNPRVYSNSCPLSRWCHPTSSSSFVPFFDFKWIASYILKNLCNLSIKYKEYNTFVPTTQRKKWNFTHTFKASHVHLPPN